jgi:hypothetical protein
MIESIRRNRRKSTVALALLAFVVGLLGINMSGAYFSDTHSGTVSGTVGSIRITPSGGSGADNMDLGFDHLLPGDPQTVTLTYTNTGENPQDVWVKFNNPTALSALNTLGTYGEVHVVSNGVEKFGSANLNDRTSTCGAFSPSGCWPLPSQIKLADNVAPGATGVFKFTFGYAAKLKTQHAPNTTAPWNTYPVVAGLWSPSNPDGQQVINAADGSGSGLPYQLVATQVGQTP